MKLVKQFAWQCLKPFYKILRPSFSFQGKKYPYFWRAYNMTWRSERCVEIPIVREVVEQNAGKRILEIGNVLSHYFPRNYDVVDKYEKSAGVLNEDIVAFKPKGRPYDLIVSISTMEHVGWDEDPKEPEKFLKAFENIKNNCLAPGGKLVVTIPIGYNPFLDEAIASGKLGFTRKHYMKRLSKVNDWAEADFDQVRTAKFMAPYPFANGLLIATFEKMKNDPT